MAENLPLPKSRMYPIHQLPAELAIQISRYLSGRDLVAFMGVDKKLHDTLKINVLDKLALKPIDGTSSLNWAAAHGCEGQVKAVIKLIKFSANISLNDYNVKIQDAFNIAVKAYYECAGIVEILLNEGAKLDIPDKDNFGQLPIHVAAITNSPGTLGVLVRRGANINAVDDLGNTPLHYAFESHNERVARILLRSGADTTVINKVGDTLLHSVAWRTDGRGLELAKELLINGADANAQKANGKTPLHEAIVWYNGEWGAKAMVKVLIEGGADVNARDKYGLTPLHCATNSQNEQAVLLLLELNAAIDVEDELGETVLGWVSDQGSLSFSPDFRIISGLILSHYNARNRPAIGAGTMELQTTDRDWMGVWESFSRFYYLALFVYIMVLGWRVVSTYH